jgi:alpha-glucosidase
MENESYLWWQTEIIYHIYPLSFKDSNGDGKGDIRGIIEKLDYLDDLDVKGIWISPVFPSPMADFGYDVKDYRGIHPIFGTMEDFDELISAIHDRGMKLILDFVANHTSVEHPWFRESRSSTDNGKRDWYIWKEPKHDGSPPNNWVSVMGGPAWEFDETTGQYYYHAFLKEQADLNWHNPQVREAMLDAMEFWLKKGVDGFRVDAMWHIIKDEQYRDNPLNPDYHESMKDHERLIAAYSTNQPESHEIIHMMQKLVDSYDERVLIFEFKMPLEELVVYYGLENSGANLPFNFQLIEQPWDARYLDAGINEYEGSLPPGSWPNWVLGNHDVPRVASRVLPGQAGLAAILLMTLRGTPIMYYGDEIGMRDVDIPDDRILDPLERTDPDKGLGRDPQRSPMQWDGSQNAGFTEGKPWLPLMKEYEQVNVASQLEDPDSLLNLYRRLIALRSEEPMLKTADFFPHPAGGDLIAYRRAAAGKDFLIVLNLGEEKASFTPDFSDWTGIVRLSVPRGREEDEISGEIILEGSQGLVIERTMK